jgi:hypothetical protein
MCLQQLQPLVLHRLHAAQQHTSECDGVEGVWFHTIRACMSLSSTLLLWRTLAERWARCFDSVMSLAAQAAQHSTYVCRHALFSLMRAQLYMFELPA